MKDISNYSLLKHNTFGIDAKCSRYVEISAESEAMEVLPVVCKTNYIIIGGGSNLLLTRDYEGTVLRSGIMGIETICKDGDILVRCGSGVVWDDVVAYCVENGYAGAENLSLIPGEVGASAVQNIGAYGAEIKDILHSVEAIEIATGKKRVFSVEECKYSYRNSIFKQELKNKYFITYVTYKLSADFVAHLDYGNIRNHLEGNGISAPTMKQLRDAIIEIRNAKLPDPKVLGNAGSFFMNPIVSRAKFEELLNEYPSMPHYQIDDSRVKIPAGWMIEQCGWKGKTLGNAGVHDKQALVLVNRGGASGEEVVNLCNTIRHDVEQKFGIVINPEVNII